MFTFLSSTRADPSTVNDGMHSYDPDGDSFNNPVPIHPTISNDLLITLPIVCQSYANRLQFARRTEYYKAVSVNPKTLIILRSNDFNFLQEAGSLLDEHFCKNPTSAPDSSNLMVFDEPSSKKENGRAKASDDHKRDVNKTDSLTSSDSESKSLQYEIDFLKEFEGQQFDMATETRNLIKCLCIRRGDYVLWEDAKLKAQANGQNGGTLSDEANGTQQKHRENRNGGYPNGHRRARNSTENAGRASTENDGAASDLPPRRRRTDERTDRQPYGPGRGRTESTGGSSDFKTSDYSSPEQSAENGQQTNAGNSSRVRGSFHRNEISIEKEAKIKILVDEVKNIDRLPRDDGAGGVNYEDRYETKCAKYDNRSAALQNGVGDEPKGEARNEAKRQEDMDLENRSESKREGRSESRREAESGALEPKDRSVSAASRRRSVSGLSQRTESETDRATGDEKDEARAAARAQRRVTKGGINDFNRSFDVRDLA